jgi:hypothetical protein
MAIAVQDRRRPAGRAAHNDCARDLDGRDDRLDVVAPAGLIRQIPVARGIGQAYAAPIEHHQPAQSCQPVQEPHANRILEQGLH